MTPNGSEPDERDRGVAVEPERALLNRIARGDRAAFRRLFEVYHRRLLRFCSRLLSDPQLVEEVVNDTLLVVWRRADSFNARSRVSTWIFGIAYRLAMKALAARPAPMDDTATHCLQAAHAGPGIDTQLEDAERRALLEAAFRRLSPEHRAVLELAYFMGYSCAEIGAIVECPVNTVKTRLFKARERLRTLWPRLARAVPACLEESAE